MTWQFVLTSIVVTAAPGAGALFTVAAGLSRGARAGLIAAAGCTVGIVPHMMLALSGVAAVLAASPVAFGTVKWLGVGYLLYLAWGTWRHRGVLAPPVDDANEQSRPTVFRTIGSAVLVNLLNPKLTVFFFVFLPMFVDPDEPGALGHMTVLALVFMAITVAIFAVYGLCAAWLRRYVIGNPVVTGWIHRICAVSFVALAVVVAVSHR